MKDLRNHLVWMLTFFAVILFTACSKSSDLDLSEEEEVDNSESTVSEITGDNCATHEADADYTWTSSSVIPVVLNGSSITVSSSGASVSGSTLTISSAGTYSFSGSLTNGQIIVNTEDKETVRLILNGVSVTCSQSAPIYVKKAEKAVLILADNTSNTLTDGSTYTYDNASDEEPNACVFSKSDLSISGNGSLTINANFNDGINTKDGLVIKSGNIKITAKDDAIRGKDYMVIHSGTFDLTASGDGLKSDNDSDATKGYISIDKGTYTIVSGGDAIAAQTDVLISDGLFTLTSGGGSSKTASSTVSSKAIKGTVCVVIDKGTFTISSADDAVHSNSSVAINGGSFTISSGDDGLHADTALGISGGDINITKSYEGIESAYITINNGTIHVTASDDGINGAGGSDSSGTGGWGGPGAMPSSGNYYLYVNGGYIYVNAGGDGIDVNGSIEMTNGTVIVNGPTDNGNGPLDYDGSFKISGGFLLAVGSSGMAQAPGTGSSQYSVLLNLSSAKTAGTLVSFQTSDGKELFTFAPAKKYQSIAFSSPDLKSGSSYDVYVGGSSTGTATDGLYSGGTYSDGTKYTSITLSGTTTKVTK